jgi:hypothetical protein
VADGRIVQAGEVLAAIKAGGPANFDGCTIVGDLDLSALEINGKVHFSHTIFRNKANFDQATFNGTADFGGADFKDTAGFQNASFNISNFLAAQFNKEAQFDNALFSAKATFDNIRFKEDALFENAVFQDKLSLTRARYGKLFIRWHSIQGSLVYDDAAYMSLMKNFKDLGYYEDYDSCYFQYRKAHRAVPWPAVSGWEQFIRKAIDYPMEWFYGYGTKPFNAFFISLFIVIVFSIFWWHLGLGGPKDRTQESLEKGEEWLDGDLFDLLSFSATVFLSGTRLLIDPPALPKIEGRSRSMIRKAFILERVLGALFSVMFFIAISGTIVRAS